MSELAAIVQKLRQRQNESAVKIRVLEMQTTSESARMNAYRDAADLLEDALNAQKK